MLWIGPVLLGLLVAGTALVLRFGDPQCCRWVYLFQRHVSPGREPRVPPTYTGTWTTWHRSGRRASETAFKDGLVHGKARHWDTNGVLRRENTYVRQVLHGKEIVWDKRGRVIAEGEYMNGQRFGGTFVGIYSSSGEVLIEEYRNGKFVRVLDGSQLHRGAP